MNLCMVLYCNNWTSICTILLVIVLFFFNNLCQFRLYYFWHLIVLILFCRFAMASSCPELDLEFLTKRKDNVEVPQGIDTTMCFFGDNCKLVRCKVLGTPTERTMWFLEGVNRITSNFWKKAAVKTPIGTTDVMPVLPTGSVLPVPSRYYRQGRVDLKWNLNSAGFLANLLESKS
jgi:hypothetical protein